MVSKQGNTFLSQLFVGDRGDSIGLFCGHVWVPGPCSPVSATLNPHTGWTSLQGLLGPQSWLVCDPNSQIQGDSELLYQLEELDRLRPFRTVILSDFKGNLWNRIHLFVKGKKATYAYL